LLNSAVLPFHPSGPSATCASCAERLLAVIRSLHGVLEAHRAPEDTVITIGYDPARLSSTELEQQLAAAEADLASHYHHHVYRVTAGFDCAHCAAGLETMARGMAGVASAVVRFAAAEIAVEYTADKDGQRAIAELPRRAAAMGFALSSGTAMRSATDEADAVEATKTRQALPIWLAPAIGATLLAMGLLIEHTLPRTALPSWIADALFGVSLLFSGARFAQAGLAALRSRIIGTHLLMVVAAIGAAVLGCWEEAAEVVTLYAIGVALEAAAMERTRRGIRELIHACPAEALIQRPDLRHEIVPADTLAPGDVLVVRPGASIAADGEVISGRSSVVEAVITGESLPADKGSGDRVYAGSINSNGTLLVLVTAPAADSALATMVRLAQEAQARRAPTEAIIDRFGRVYTPLVLTAALLMAVVGPLLAPGIPWLYRALTLLVVACPCALVIATPVAYVSAITAAARRGILVKGGATLEALASVRTFLLDKTGTLTTGELRVSDVVTATGAEPSIVAGAAAAVARLSAHPVARAVTSHTEMRRGADISLSEVRFAHELPGRGIEAEIVENGVAATVLLGNLALMEERSVALPEDLAHHEHTLRTKGKSTLLLALNGTTVSVWAVEDTLRQESVSVVAALSAGSQRQVTMLTGDTMPVAQAVAAQCNIEDVRAGLLPADKLAAVQSAAAALPKGTGIAFVGDGINDAPALSAATVGIAVASLGTGVAASAEAADVVLTGGGLRALPALLELSSATRWVVRGNVMLAVLSAALLIGGTLLGWVALPTGVLAHEGIALLVTLNGLSLLRPGRYPLADSDDMVAMASGAVIGRKTRAAYNTMV
jgi:Cd2+/Zn2+-exporting ATPase